MFRAFVPPLSRTAAQFQILDQRYRISIDEHIAVSVFHHARPLRSFFLGPFVAAGGTLPMIRVHEYVFEGARGTGRFRHGEKNESASITRRRRTPTRNSFLAMSGAVVNCPTSRDGIRS